MYIYIYIFVISCSTCLSDRPHSFASILISAVLLYRSPNRLQEVGLHTSPIRLQWIHTNLQSYHSDIIMTVLYNNLACHLNRCEDGLPLVLLHVSLLSYLSRIPYLIRDNRLTSVHPHRIYITFICVYIAVYMCETDLRRLKREIIAFASCLSTSLLSLFVPVSVCPYVRPYQSAIVVWICL